MFKNESRHFLKNSNLLDELHKSKLTYCCYEDKKPGRRGEVPCGYPPRYQSPRESRSWA